MKIEYNEIQIKGAKKYGTEPGDICPCCGELMGSHSTIMSVDNKMLLSKFDTIKK